MIDIPERTRNSASHRAIGKRWWLAYIRTGIAVLGVLLLLVGGSMRGLGLAPTLIVGAFVALLGATLIGGLEGWPTRGGRQARSQALSDSWPAGWSQRVGIGVVVAVTTIAAQSWFEPGLMLAGGDVYPVIGTAWLGRLFIPWSWSGSNLGGPAANETELPLAVVYWITHALHGSPALAERIWYTALFAGAAVGCFLLLRALRISPAASVIGAFAYVFNAHVVDIGFNTVFLAAMVLLPWLPIVVINAASGQWALRKSILFFAASAPLLGYVSLNPPLVLMLVMLLIATPLLVGWLDGWPAARQAIRAIISGGILLAFASAYWIIPTILQIKIDATATLASQSSWTWSEGRATLANGFWLNNDWGWNFAEYFPYAETYRQFPLLALKYLLPVTGFAYIAIARFSGTISATSRRIRLGIAASLAALFFVLLSTGTHLPGALVFDPLYQLPFGWMLQDPGRFLIVAGLAYSALLALIGEAVAEKVKLYEPFSSRHWRPISPKAGIHLAGVSLAGLAVLAPGYPLVTGVIAPDHRPVLPPSHVRVPTYWTEMASYLNASAPTGNLLLLPQDDFYQMPYIWGYYGADGFITDLITRNVLDPSAQGYAPAAQEVATAVSLIQQGLLAHDWRSVQRILGALTTPLILVRGDVNAAFPGRHITRPQALDRALRADPDMRLLRRFGKLELFRILHPISATGTSTSYATVNSATPDLRDLSLLARGTSLISGVMRPGVPALLQVPVVSQWRLSGNQLQTAIAEPAGRRYRVKLLSPTGAYKNRDLTVSRRRAGRVLVRRIGLRLRGDTSVLLTTSILHQKGRNVEQFSYKLGRSLLSDGKFATGTWSPVGNCDAFPGTTKLARLSARILPEQGPGGSSALALSAYADSACESRPLTWRSKALFISLWVRNVSGSSPRVCLWQTPLATCAALPPISPTPVHDKWERYQTIVTPSPGTRNLTLFLYADVYTVGQPTINEYAKIAIRQAPRFAQPIVLATRQRFHGERAALNITDESFSSTWLGPQREVRVKVDGLRNGWLGQRLKAGSAHFSLSLWYQMSRVISLVAGGLLLVLALSVWRRNRRPDTSGGPVSHGLRSPGLNL